MFYDSFDFNKAHLQDLQVQARRESLVKLARQAGKKNSAQSQTKQPSRNTTSQFGSWLASLL
ncbi:MAG TPA: hypothetical protein VH186_13730 [Chloroflexia bacterium]|nr:hypothetical protein [Chloroflexia bacterium]